MGVFSRLSDIINSNLNTMLDRAENPEKIMRMMIQEMEDTLVEVRSAAAKSIAEKKELARRMGQLQVVATDWQGKAELALEKGREDLAKAALLAKAKATDTAALVAREIDAVEEALAKTEHDLAKLQAKLTEAKNKQKSFELRRRSAEDRLRVRTHLHDGRIDDALARYDQFERKLDDLEARVESYDLGKGAQTLEQEIEALAAEDAITSELEALKAKLKQRG